MTATQFISTRLFARAIAGAAAVLTVGALTACGSDDDASTTLTQAESVTLTDQWIKAADTEMTAEFGILTNNSDNQVTVTGGRSDAAGSVEVHEITEADGVRSMQEIQGGLTIPAGATVELTPGGNHIMLMDLTRPIRAGDQVTITLTFADGSTLDASAQARDFSGNQEKYADHETSLATSHAGE